MQNNLAYIAIAKLRDSLIAIAYHCNYSELQDALVSNARALVAKRKEQ